MSLTPCGRELLRDRQVARLGHPRRADRAGVAQDEDVVGRHVEVGCVDPRREVVERVEDDRAAGVLEQARRRRRLLDDRAARREVAAQHGHAAAGADRIRARADHVLRVARVDVRDPLAERRAGDVARIQVEQVAQLVEQARHAAGPVEVLHVVPARRLQVDEHRHLAAERVDFVEVDRDPEPSRGRGEMDQAVGRAADRLQDDKGVAKRRARHDLARRRPAALGHRHRDAPALLGRAQTVGVRRRDARRGRQREAHRLDDARHRARRSHHHARSRRRREARVDGLDLGGVDAGRRGSRSTGAGSRCTRRASRRGGGRRASARPGRRSPAGRPTRRPSSAPESSCRSRRSGRPRPSAARGSSPRCPSPSGCAGTCWSDARTTRGSRSSGTPSAARRRASRRA